MSIDDFANNREYITVHVYESGERVFYSDNALVQGTKINSPHYLVKLSPPRGKHRLRNQIIACPSSYWMSVTEDMIVFIFDNSV